MGPCLGRERGAGRGREPPPDLAAGGQVGAHGRLALCHGGRGAGGSEGRHGVRVRAPCGAAPGHSGADPPSLPHGGGHPPPPEPSGAGSSLQSGAGQHPGPCVLALWYTAFWRAGALCRRCGICGRQAARATRHATGVGSPGSGRVRLSGRVQEARPSPGRQRASRRGERQPGRRGVCLHLSDGCVSKERPGPRNRSQALGPAPRSCRGGGGAAAQPPLSGPRDADVSSGVWTPEQVCPRPPGVRGARQGGTQTPRPESHSQAGTRRRRQGWCGASQRDLSPRVLRVRVPLRAALGRDGRWDALAGAWTCRLRSPRPCPAGAQRGVGVSPPETRPAKPPAQRCPRGRRPFGLRRSAVCVASPAANPAPQHGRAVTGPGAPGKSACPGHRQNPQMLESRWWEPPPGPHRGRRGPNRQMTTRGLRTLTSSRGPRRLYTRPQLAPTQERPREGEAAVLPLGLTPRPPTHTGQGQGQGQQGSLHTQARAPDKGPDGLRRLQKVPTESRVPVKPTHLRVTPGEPVKNKTYLKGGQRT